MRPVIKYILWPLSVNIVLIPQALAPGRVLVCPPPRCPAQVTAPRAPPCWLSTPRAPPTTPPRPEITPTTPQPPGQGRAPGHQPPPPASFYPRRFLSKNEINSDNNPIWISGQVSWPPWASRCSSSFPSLCSWSLTLWPAREWGRSPAYWIPSRALWTWWTQPPWHQGRYDTSVT